MKHDDDVPHDETTSMNDEPLPGDASVYENGPPAPATEEPAIVSFSDADFDDLLGRYDDLVLHVVVDHVGDDDDGEGGLPARAGRYELSAP